MTFLYTVFGWPLGWIMYLCYQVVANYGFALILFTVITKLLQLPLAIKTQKNQVKNAIFAPKQKAIQDKYGNNKEKMNEELMKLYQQEKYNPMSGCLPSLITFPILFGMIDVIYKPITHILRPGNVDALMETATRILGELGLANGNTMASQIQVINAIQTDPAPWATLGTEFITKAQSIDFTFLGVDLSATPTMLPGGLPMGVYIPLLLVPILSGVTALLTSIQTQRQMRTSGQEMAGGGMMKGMMYFMPLFSLWFAFQVPAGVGMYWLLSNVLTMVQAYFLNKKYNPSETIAKIKAEQEEEKAREKAERKELKEKKAKGELSEEEKAKILSEKDLAAKRIAEARKRMAEKYGETYVEEE